MLPQQLDRGGAQAGSRGLVQVSFEFRVSSFGSRVSGCGFGRGVEVDSQDVVRSIDFGVGDSELDALVIQLPLQGWRKLET